MCDTCVTHGYSHCEIVFVTRDTYGVASVCWIDKIIGLFCKRALLKRLYSAKETCNFIDPTNGSHPICAHIVIYTQESLSNIVLSQKNI